MIEVREIGTPIGRLTIAVRGGRVCLLHFGSDEPRIDHQLARWYGTVTIERVRTASDVTTRLLRYFDGDLPALDGIDVEMNGTPFQRRVWQALRGIPAGRTTSYGALARQIGDSKAVRAVGAANGANPVAVIVPCHRVIGSNGTLTGYGGGLDRKRWLLAHEVRHSGLFAGGRDEPV